MPRQPHSGGPLGNWGRGTNSGGKALAHSLNRQLLDALESGRIFPDPANSPVDTTHQLAYLFDRQGGTQALADAGVPASTRNRWQRTGSHPSAKNADRVNHAYWSLRATNWKRTGRPPSRDVRQAIAEQLTQRMHGRSLTVIPVSAQQVQPQARGAQQTAARKLHTAPERTKRPSNHQWDDFLTTWATDDADALDDAWMDYCGDIDSPPEPYYEVTHIGFML